MGCSLHRIACRLKIRIAFIATTIGTGGAEAMLVKLVGALDRERFIPSVIVLGERASFAEQLEAVGAGVLTLDLERPTQAALGLIRLLKAVLTIEPHLIQGW